MALEEYHIFGDFKFHSLLSLLFALPEGPIMRFVATLLAMTLGIIAPVTAVGGLSEPIVTAVSVSAATVPLPRPYRAPDVDPVPTPMSTTMAPAAPAPAVTTPEPITWMSQQVPPEPVPMTGEVRHPAPTEHHFREDVAPGDALPFMFESVPFPSPAPDPAAAISVTAALNAIRLPTEVPQPTPAPPKPMPDHAPAPKPAPVTAPTPIPMRTPSPRTPAPAPSLDASADPRLVHWDLPTVPSEADLALDAAFQSTHTMTLSSINWGHTATTFNEPDVRGSSGSRGGQPRRRPTQQPPRGRRSRRADTVDVALPVRRMGDVAQLERELMPLLEMAVRRGVDLVGLAEELQENFAREESDAWWDESVV